MLELVEQPLDHLLGLDTPSDDPDEHAVFGYALAPGLELWGQGGEPTRLRNARIVGFHRSDDQSQAKPGSMDLEFALADQDLVVDLAQFVEHRLKSLVSGWDNLVIALCNPDGLELGPMFRPLLTVLQGPLYWADGVVQASYEEKSGPRGLEAVRWHREV